MEEDKSFQKHLDKLKDIPSVNTLSKVKELMDEWMPDTSEVIRSAVDAMIEEDQDYPIIYFGIPGIGKSNLALMHNTFKSGYLKEEYGLKNRFSLKNSAWLGEQYVTMLERPAMDLLKIKSMADVNELKEKWKGTIFWMDEAQDLNALEFTNTFNIAMNKIIATIRALQLIYSICIDFPTKLLPDIRQGRVKTAYYVIIHNSKFNFNGVMRNKRACFMYGRREWVNVATASNKDVRVGILVPNLFIKRFPTSRAEFVPPFPKCKFLEKYNILKFRNMGKNTMKELDKVKRKREDRERIDEKRRGTNEELESF